MSLPVSTIRSEGLKQIHQHGDLGGNADQDAEQQVGGEDRGDGDQEDDELVAADGIGLP